MHWVLALWPDTGFVFDSKGYCVLFKASNPAFSKKKLKKIKYGSVPSTLFTENVYSCQLSNFK